MGYGLRYEYGMFRQQIVDGQQVETPDYWLTRGNPWEFQRPEVNYRVRFGGHVQRREGTNAPYGAADWVDTHDVLAVTDFPDIRLKSAILSANQGNLLIIPREGGYLVRLYIELDQVHVDAGLGDVAAGAHRGLRVRHLRQRAQDQGPDGRFVVYETGAGAERVTYLTPAAGPPAVRRPCASASPGDRRGVVAVEEPDLWTTDRASSTSPASSRVKARPARDVSRW